MKIVRGIALALLYFAVFFITMVFTTMSLLAGWQFGLGLLGIIWVAYFVCSLLRWKFLSALVLAAFVGYATGLLRQVDQFTTPEQVDLISWLPSRWLAYVGLAFFFVFIAILPGMASMLADKCRAKFNPVASSDDQMVKPARCD